MPATRRQRYELGDHVCALYSTRDELLSVVVDYIREGLSRGERCIYSCGEHTRDEVRAALVDADANVDQEEATGALILLTKHEAHLNGGSFDPDQMISMLEGAAEDAVDDGFTGLRSGGDMSWLLDGADGSDRLAEYEARLNEFFPSTPALGLCLYNRKVLPSVPLDHSIATHPHVRLGDGTLLHNPFYETPRRAVLRRPDPAGLSPKLAWLEKLRAGIHTD